MAGRAKERIDFAVIGAQKSGTTSLFRYLSLHPCVYMPPEKEIDFFSNDKNFERGTGWYLDTYFGSSDPSKLWGEASTTYMFYDIVPERLYRTYPNIKLIAILRNPIDRAYSHYRMAVRNELEDRPFEFLIKELVTRGNVPDNEVNIWGEFIMFGEYGRILSGYTKYFSKDQIKIVFLEDMNSQPASCMKEIFIFLGLKNFESKIYDRKYHFDGIKRFPRLERLLMEQTLKSRLVKGPVRLLLSPQTRRAIGFWFNMKFNIKKTQDPGPNHEVRQFLVEYFEPDVKLLEGLFGIKVPWVEFS